MRPSMGEEILVYARFRRALSTRPGRPPSPRARSPPPRGSRVASPPWRRRWCGSARTAPGQSGPWRAARHGVVLDLGPLLLASGRARRWALACRDLGHSAAPARLRPDGSAASNGRGSMVKSRSSRFTSRPSVKWTRSICPAICDFTVTVVDACTLPTAVASEQAGAVPLRHLGDHDRYRRCRRWRLLRAGAVGTRGGQRQQQAERDRGNRSGAPRRRP